MDRYLAKVQSASAVIVKALPFLALCPSGRQGVSLSSKDGHPDEGCNPFPLLEGRCAGIETLKATSDSKEQEAVVSCDCGSPEWEGRIWMNLWEEVESTGNEAGVLRVDDSNDRGPPAGMATREAVKVHQRPSRSLGDVICALLGACRRLANHRPPCSATLSRVTLDSRDSTHKAKPHG